jgi:hypothetical protein
LYYNEQSQLFPGGLAKAVVWDLAKAIAAKSIDSLKELGISCIGLNCISIYSPTVA